MQNSEKQSTLFWVSIPMIFFMLFFSGGFCADEKKDTTPTISPTPQSVPTPPASKPLLSPLSPLKTGLEFLEGVALTEEQKLNISNVYDESQQKITQFRIPPKTEDKEIVRNRDVLQKIRQVQQETFAEIQKILTEQQKEEIIQRIRMNFIQVSSREELSPFQLFADPIFVANLRANPENTDEWRSPFELSEAESEQIPANIIDKPVLNILTQKQITPAIICSDAVFLRRVYLDVIGTLPTVKETTDFLNNKQPNKRSSLIDTLLERPEFVEYWALKWGDTLRVKAEFPIRLWPNGAMVYHRWIRDSVRSNKPIDVFARELLLGTGSNFRNPPANFYRAVQNRDPNSIAEAVALTFLGVRLEHWHKEKQDQMSVFFSRVGYKDSAEWKEEIVYWNDKPLELPEVILPDGQKVRVAEDQDPRQIFADWLVTPQNPWFTKNLVNRIWFWVFGRGIVHEPDDFREDNLPSNPELLNLLVSELVQSRYDFRQFLRLILNSRTYQLSSIPRTTHPEAELLCAFYPSHQVEAEVLQDMFRQILGVNIQYASDVPEPFMYIPDWRRTIMIADGSITSPFLETFGRPTRDSGVESDRNPNATVAQRMFLINSSEMMQWIENSWRLRNAANAASNAGKNSEERRILMLHYLWLTILTRYPTSHEINMAKALFDQKLFSQIKKNDTVIYQDLIWTLFNTKEFLCKH
ncbi:MAG: DUF1553 domain-containing protein [Planctomycetaceae bacterium]|jgi:hypothetical protein|nr:DUF1553 domain-containing protein [Planctomycetaceae bacterium]